GDDAGRRAGVDFGLQPVASLVGAAAVELWVGVRPPGALAAGAVTAAREGALQVVPAFGGGDVGGDDGHGVTLGASADSGNGRVVRFGAAAGPRAGIRWWMRRARRRRPRLRGGCRCRCRRWWPRSRRRAWCLAR